MRQMLEVHPGREEASVWNKVWIEDQYSSLGQRQRRARKRFEVASAYFRPMSGETVLDLGCGGGEFLKILSDEHSNIRLIGLDFSEVAISRAQISLGEGVEFACANVLELPINADCIDRIYCFGVLEHVSKVRAALSEMERVMRPGSRALISLSSILSFQQIYNSVRLALTSYPYGYQRNHTIKTFEEELPPQLSIMSTRFVHADSDQNHVRIPDLMVSLVKEAWARYIFVEVEKGH